MAILRQNRVVAFWTGLCIHVIWIWHAPAQPTGGRAPETVYEYFQGVEESAKRIRESSGDESYLLTLFCGHHMLHAASCYKIGGAHPEIEPPTRKSWEDQAHRGIRLDAAREFLQKNYFDLWAAAYLVIEMAPVEKEDSSERKEDSLDENDPFSDQSEIPDTGHRWQRDRLGFFYSEDLFLQKRVEQLARLHGNDDSELVAGLTGRQIIAYMREHLPEPDPRVLTGRAEPAVKRPIVDPENRFSDAAVGRVVADGSADRRTRPYLWPLLALVLMACAWGFIFVRRVRR